ncbi:metallopeptidase family protein [Allostreptomyces psammosilenae]|uniref:Putative Zn-dependent protease with MMP-like domain n=1 Tax=Allostreptomyces psammosilenae TaxID=1892865 RepID=A0A852ZUU5_9ACTN|nr:metallopeptidase family protein [Allostreptomyces psammosilenae]NYI06156.1 putative Zn-dependent protease with MMP-like domain [Allostreptomyces psammosilenae]
MDSSVPQRPADPRPAGRRRDRHGRGMRGPLAPADVPVAMTRAERFDDLVRESMERLTARWPQLETVLFEVVDVPWESATPSELSGGRVALAQLVPESKGQPARIVVFRRPVEVRAKPGDERATLVHDAIVEQVAELLGMSPETVDPRFGLE